ncbi:MAG: HAE1 family hydrophobic/amphiphilic exporter-1, partial [Planctomycetota bacterium]
MNGPVEKFVGLTLKRPVTVLMLLCSTVLIGILAQSRLPLELLPSGFVMSSVSINIPVPNANPIEVEEQVTRPTEDIIRQMSGLEEIETRSSKDSSNINLKFSKDRNPDEAFAEVRDLMEIAKLSWPEEVQDYRTFRFNLDTDIAIFSFGVLLDEWESDTSFVLDEKVTKVLESVDGVARISNMGIVEESIRIFVDKEKARSLGISLFEVAQTLGADNKDIIGGRVKEGDRYFYLRSLGRFESIEELENYPIRANVRMKDVAEIVSAKSFRDWVFRLNGSRAVWFEVYKESSANTVEVCNAVKKTVEEKIMTDVRMKEKGWEWYQNDNRNTGSIVTGALTGLVKSALIGALFAIIPLFLFLRRIRMTLIIMLAIPSSLLITIGCIYFGGGTMNLLSMMGITIAIGMLVDNSIVVVENIFSKRQEGMGAQEAALKGTAEVALAVTLATLTTVAAFLPLIFMDAGKEAAFFSKAIGLPVCYAVVASLIVALFFIPLATVFFYSDRNDADSNRSFYQNARDRLAGKNQSMSKLVARLALVLTPMYFLADWTLKGIGKLEKSQSWTLRHALKHRLFALILIFGVTGGITYEMTKHAKFVKMDDNSGGFIRLNIELDNNYTLGDANEVFVRVYQVLKDRWDEFGFDVSYLWFRRSGGPIFAALKNTDGDYTQRVSEAIKKNLPDIPGAKITVGVDRQNQDASNLDIRIFGKEVKVLAGISEDLKVKLEKVDGITRVSGGVAKNTEEIIIAPDRERMQFFGVEPRTLMGTVQYGIRGQRLPDFHFGDQKMRMFIEYENAGDTSVDDLKRLGIWTESGKTQPLSNFADIYYAKGYGTIRKQNGQSSVNLTVETLDGKDKKITSAVAQILSEYNLPKGYSWQETSDEDLKEEAVAIAGTAALAVVLILLLMGVLFESVMLPPAVFATIPFALIGAFWFLVLTGSPVDMMSMIGGIILVGIVVNNGIVFMDAAHRSVLSGVERTEALITAGKR